jgi:hypothetical protein
VSAEPVIVSVVNQPTTNAAGNRVDLRPHPLGQTVIFSIEVDEDRRYPEYGRVAVRVGDTVAKIVGKRLGHPNLVDQVATLNHVSSSRQILRHSPNKRSKYYASAKTRRHDRTVLHLPGTLNAAKSEGGTFEVYASLDGAAPTITGGYAKLEVQDRPGRTGISHFVGYDPSEMEIPITFDRVTPAGEGEGLEDDMWALERMAGRGSFHGASTGPPPVIRISTLDKSNPKKRVPLIPSNYQWSDDNEHAPIWRISGIDWDRNPIRNKAGNRIRQQATVTVQAYTRTSTVARSVVKRTQSSRSKKAQKKHKKK